MNEKALPLAMTGLATVMLAVSGASLFVSLQAANTVDALSEKVEKFERSQSGALARLNELDAGMLAIVRVQNIDGGALSKAMALEMAEMRGDKSSPAPALKVSDDQTKEPVPAIASVVSPEVPPLSAAPVKAAPVETLELAPSVQAVTVQVNAQGAKQTAAAAGKDFEAIVQEMKSAAPAEPEPDVASTPAATPAPTIATVDSILVKRIGENWAKPAGETKGLVTEIVMKMSRDGKLDEATVSRSSGNDKFDRSAVQALKNMGVIPEISKLDDATYNKAYRNRTILFSPELMGG